MEELFKGFIKAVYLILTLDKEVLEIATRSLLISLTSTAVASVISIPLGALIHFYKIPLKRFIITIIHTLFSLPTVCVGLIVFVVLSRSGPLGDLRLLFTPTGIVIGQVILITPIVIGLTLSALSNIDKDLYDLALSLGASKKTVVITILQEAKFAIFSAIIMAFGRAISEVGISMMIGGNIRGYTRTITTAIALETSKGELELSFALGIILMLIAFLVNLLLSKVRQV